MGGEDGLQRRPVDQRDHIGGRYARLNQRDEAFLEAALGRFPLGGQNLHPVVLDPVDLLGHVGEMEVDGEGLGQLQGVFEVHLS